MIIRRASGWKGLQLPVKQTEDTGNWQNTEEDSDFKLINCAAFWLRIFFSNTIDFGISTWYYHHILRAALKKNKVKHIIKTLSYEGNKKGDFISVQSKNSNRQHGLSYKRICQTA